MTKAKEIEKAVHGTTEKSSPDLHGDKARNQPTTDVKDKDAAERREREAGRSGSQVNQDETANARTRIKVRATAPGFYDNTQREKGDVFYVAREQDFSNKWMERADDAQVGRAPGTVQRQTSDLENDRARAHSSGGPLDPSAKGAPDNPADNPNLLHDKK